MGGENKRGEEREPEEWTDSEKREAALRFETSLEQVREDEAYEETKEAHRGG